MTSSINPIPAFINRKHTGKALEGADKVFSRYMDWTQYEITTPEEYVNILYCDGNPVIATKLDLATWKTDKQYPTPRNMPYFKGSSVMWLDYDGTLSDLAIIATIAKMTPQDAWRTWIKYLVTIPLIRDYAAAIVPSSGFSPSLPKSHILFWQDGLVSDYHERKSLWWRLEGQAYRELGIKSDDQLQIATQPIFGTRFTKIDDSLRSEISPYVRDVVTPLALIVSWEYASYAKIKQQSDKPARERATPVERPPVDQGTEAHTLMLLKHVLDTDHVNGAKLKHTDWLGMIWSALYGASPASVYTLIYDHPMWEYAYRSSTKLATLDDLIAQADGYSWHTLATLERMAAERVKERLISGLVGSPDHRYSEQDVTTGNIDLSPDTVHLIAPTASHKSAWFEHLVNRATSGLFIAFVPRVTLIEQLVTELRAHTDAHVCHYDKDFDDFQSFICGLGGKVVLVTTPNSIYKNEDIIRYWLAQGGQIAAISLEEYGQGVGMWEDMKGNSVQNFRIVQQMIAIADKVIVPDGTEGDFVRTWVDGLRPESNSAVISIQPIHEKAPVQAYYGTTEAALGYVYNKIISSVDRIAVAFDTTRQLKAVLDKLREYNQGNPERTIRYVVSANQIELTDSERADSLAFEADPNGQAPNFDVYLYTTKLGTGVSVTSVSVKERIVVVGNVTSPADHVQKINRFRRHEENIVLFAGINDNKALTKAMEMNEAVSDGASQYRAQFDLGATDTKVALDAHIAAYHAWVARLKTGGINTLLNMLERDGMARPEKPLPIVVNEPLPVRAAKMTPEQAESLATDMCRLGAIPPRLADRADIDTSMNTAVEIELRAFYGLLYLRFGANLVNENLAQCVLGYGKSVNEGHALYRNSVLMGIRDDYAEDLQKRLKREQAATKENDEWLTHIRVLLGREVLKVLSPKDLKTRDTCYVMTPAQWLERGKVFLAHIESNEDMYNRAVGDKRNRLDQLKLKHPKDGRKRAYTALKAIAAVNGIVVESQRVGHSNEHVPALVGLDQRWILINGRAAKDATLQSLKNGQIPENVIIPAVNLDWCKLADDLWMQIESIRTLVGRRSSETLDIYQAWINGGATQRTARAKALSGIWPVKARVDMSGW